MRPGVLEHGYRPSTKLLFRMIRLMSGRPLPDAGRITFYRADFYGAHAKKLTHEASAARRSGRWETGS